MKNLRSPFWKLLISRSTCWLSSTGIGDAGSTALVSRDRCLGCFLAVNLGLSDPGSVELLQALVDLSTTTDEPMH